MSGWYCIDIKIGSEKISYPLDATYLVQLESEFLLVHVDPAVIKAMTAFIYIAIIKDVLVGYFLYRLYKYPGMKIIIIQTWDKHCLKTVLLEIKLTYTEKRADYPLLTTSIMMKPRNPSNFENQITSSSTFVSISNSGRFPVEHS